MKCRPSWSLSTLGSKMRATRIVGHPTYVSISVFPPDHIPSSRTTKYVVCCCCLHIKSRSDLYSVPSNIRTGPTYANTFRGHRLTTQKGYTSAAYKTRNIKKSNSWIVRDGPRSSDYAPGDFFQGIFLTPPTQINLEKKSSYRKKQLDGHKIFRKINISALSGRHCGPHPSSIK